MGRPLTIQAYVLDELRKSIVSGALTPNQPIRQETLARELGVSRVPVREALQTLEAEGQVIYQPHRGYLVAELSLSDLLEVYRLRELLESEAAALAAEHYTDEELDQIRQSYDEINAAAEHDDMAAMIDANRRFHFQLLEPAGMPRLMRIVRTLWDATDAYRAVYYNSEANRTRVRTEHDEILAAARKRDPQRLVRLLDEHRRHAVDTLRDTID